MAGLSAKLDRIYRGRKLGPLRVPWYASPEAQLLMVAFVCFLCPGMFNALGGLGGGGQVDPTTADNTNVILYSIFAFFGFFAGSICTELICLRWDQEAGRHCCEQEGTIHVLTSGMKGLRGGITRMRSVRQVLLT